MPGEMVQLIFKGDDGSAERMWVEIVSNVSGVMTGVLCNKPISSCLPKHGARIKFGAEHICKVE